MAKERRRKTKRRLEISMLCIARSNRMKHGGKMSRCINTFLYLILAGLLFLAATLPLSSALTFKPGVITDVKIPCTLNGAPCTNAAWCNFTIQYPNASYLVNSMRMTYSSGGDFNYSVNFPEVGTYPSKMFCTEAGLNGTSTFDILSTTTGTNNGNALPIFLAISSILLMIVAFYLDNFLMKFIAGITFMLLGVYLMIFGLGTIADLYTRGLAVIAIGLGAIMSIVAVLENVWGGDDDNETGGNYSEEDD